MPNNGAIKYKGISQVVIFNFPSYLNLSIFSIIAFLQKLSSIVLQMISVLLFLCWNIKIVPWEYMHWLENNGVAVEWLPSCETYLNSFIFHVTVTRVKITFKTSGNSQSVFKENLTGAKHVHASWSKLVCLRKWTKRLSQSLKQGKQTITIIIAKLILMINRKLLLKLIILGPCEAYI